jgi:hypothetical protein
MQHVIRTLALVAATVMVTGHASAQVACPGGTARVAGAALRTLINGNTMCAASSSNSDTWQEYHQGAGAGSLIDWKRGPGHPVDPTTTVGTWSAGNDANAVLTHNYGASAYSWLVCQQAAASTFVLVSTSGAANIAGVSVKAGQGDCATLPNAVTTDVRPNPISKRPQVTTPGSRLP